MSSQAPIKRVAFSLPHSRPSKPWISSTPLPSTPSPSFSEVSLPSTDGLATPPQSMLREMYSPPSESKPSPRLHGTPRSSLIAINPILSCLYFNLACNPHATTRHHMLESATSPGVPRLIIVNKEKFYGWKCTVCAKKGSHVVTIHDVHRAMFNHTHMAMTAAELRYHPKLQRHGSKSPRRIDSLYGLTKMRVRAVKPGDDGLEIHVDFT